MNTWTDINLRMPREDECVVYDYFWVRMVDGGVVIAEYDLKRPEVFWEIGMQRYIANATHWQPAIAPEFP